MGTTIVLIILLLLIFGGGTFVYIDYKNMQKKREEKVDEQTTFVAEAIDDISTSAIRSNAATKEATRVAKQIALGQKFDTGNLSAASMVFYETSLIVVKQFNALYLDKFLSVLKATLLYKDEYNTFYEILHEQTPFLIKLKHQQVPIDNKWRTTTVGGNSYQGIAYNVEIGIPAKNCNDTCVTSLSESLETEMKKCKVVTSYVNNESKTIGTYQLDAELELMQTLLKPTHKMNDNLFMSVSTEIGKLSISEFIPRAAESLENGYNVVLGGLIGSGKTSVMLQILGSINETTAKVGLTKEVLNSMSEYVTKYHAIVNQLLDEGFESIVFYLDEAQGLTADHVDKLLAKMDGAESQTLPTSFLLVLSKTEEEIKKEFPAAVRPGRAMLFEIEYFNKEAAATALAYMKGLPTHEYVGPRNIQFKERTSLAELWNLFILAKKGNALKRKITKKVV